MMYELNGVRLNVPNKMIKYYEKQFEPLKKWDNRGSLIDLREDILDILYVIGEDPEVLYEPGFFNELREMMGMRQALQNLKMLYDA